MIERRKPIDSATEGLLPIDRKAESELILAVRFAVLNSSSKSR
jgi:hypothetical protein